MKIAVSGKGGVGKTTFSAMLSATLALEGRNVIAVDADPDANLPSALGVPDSEPIVPLAEMEDFIMERTGAKDAYGGYFKLNPRVDDIPEQFARRIGNIHLLVLGGVTKGGGGCICPATAVLKALLTHLVLGREDAVVMDMEAGIEHLGRATAQSMDALVVVVDGGSWSAQTALRARKLAVDLGIPRVLAVVNRVRPTTDLDAIQKQLGDVPLIGQLPQDDRLSQPVIAHADGAIQPGPALREFLPTMQAIVARLRTKP